MINWVIQQKWSDLIFLSYEVNLENLLDRLPVELEPDLYEGKAFVSIVPFIMSDIKFFFTPTLPFSKLNELNLRTYVKHKGKKGIYFFTLDSDHLLGNFIAREFFSLPYRDAKVDIVKEENLLSVNSPSSLFLKIRHGGNDFDAKFSKWLTERYSLFTIKNKKVLRGDVIHPPWSLEEGHVVQFNDEFSPQFGFSSRGESLHCVYSKGLDVRFRPFVINN